jgi:8-oxo-dGTP diphosphatase
MNIVNVAKAAVFNPDGQILLLRRSRTDTRRPLDWDFPGGAIEPGEDFMDGMIREIAEETGMKIEKASLKLVYTGAAPYEPGHESVNRMLFITELPTNQEVKLSYEHDLYQWTDIESALQLFKHRFYNPALRYALEHSLLQ